MGRDKAPKARQTTNKPSTTLVTPDLLSAGSGTCTACVAAAARGGLALIAQ